MANFNLTGAQGSSATISSIGTVAAQNPFSNLTSNLTISLDDFGINSLPHVKKYQVCEIEEDLLALSTAWKRLRDIRSNGGVHTEITKLLDSELFKHVTDIDRENAAAIRDYYSKKIMVWKLKGQRLSNFREDMNTFIHSDGKTFKEEVLPLVYRLPEFHEYDVQFDEMASEHNKFIKTRPIANVTKNLKLEKTFVVGKRYSKRKEYWFTDEDDNLVTFSLVKDNPLLSLLDLHTQTPITMNAKFDIRERDNVQYMVADKYTFS